MSSRRVSCTGLISLALIASLAGCGKSDAPPAAPAAKSTDLITYAPGSPELDSIQTVVATASPLPISDDMNARLGVDESETSRVGAPIAGRVTRIMADIGQTVRAGQALAYLDAPDIGQARADVLKARADNDRKEREMQRSRLLYSGGAIARRDLEGAEADAEAAAAEMQRARLRLGNLGSGAGDSLALTSTVTGSVVDRQINPGQQIGAGQSPLFTVTDPKKLWLYVDVPETSVARARIGERIEFDVPAWPDRHFEGKITQIGLSVDPGTRRVQVRAQVTNPDLALKPEMYARARLVTDDGRRAIKVPNAALFEQGMQSYMFKVDGTGRFRRVPVKVGQRGDSASYVTDGIKDGDRIVGEGALLLNAQLAGD